MEEEFRPTVRLATTTIVATLGLIVVVLAGVVLSSANGWTATEMHFLRAINLRHTAALDVVALAINRLFGPPIASLIAVTAALLIAARARRLAPAVHFLVIVVVPWLGSEVIKLIVHRARPDIPSLAHPLVLEPGGLSFPSGHTTFATCLALGLIIAAGRTRWRAMLISIGVVICLSTAASRVYLGVHYPTDVVAAILYSIAAVAVVNSVWKYAGVPHWNKLRHAPEALPTYRGATDAR